MIIAAENAEWPFVQPLGSDRVVTVLQLKVSFGVVDVPDLCTPDGIGKLPQPPRSRPPPRPPLRLKLHSQPQHIQTHADLNPVHSAGSLLEAIWSGKPDGNF